MFVSALFRCAENPLPGADLRALKKAGRLVGIFRGERLRFRLVRGLDHDERTVHHALVVVQVPGHAAELDLAGSDVRRLTNNGAANFAPFFHPSGRKIIFCSNLSDPARRNFDLYLVDVDGTGLERVTFHEEFDGFPMWSPNGKSFVFCSNRFNSKPHETNVFLADWVD